MDISSVSSTVIQTRIDTSNLPVTTTEPTVATCLDSSSFDGPTGCVTQGGVTYEVNDGQVLLEGRRIGTCNDAGRYEVELNGQCIVGNVGELIGASFSGTLSTGTEVSGHTPDTTTELPSCRVLVGDREYEVVCGRVRLEGKDVGELDQAGNYRVTTDGKASEGNLKDLAGARIDLTATAPRDPVQELRDTYLQIFGHPITQGELELVAWSDALQCPDFIELMRTQDRQVTAAYQEVMGRAPTATEKHYWISVSYDIGSTRRSVATSATPYKLYDANLLKTLERTLPTRPPGPPAGALPAEPTSAALAYRENEKRLQEEYRPLVNPSFVRTPADAAAFDHLRETSLRLRGIDLTSVNASWAEQMITSGAAANPAFYSTIDTALTAVQQAYKTHLNREPTQAEVAHWLPFTANVEYNRTALRDTMQRLQSRQELEGVVALIGRR